MGSEMATAENPSPARRKSQPRKSTAPGARRTKAAASTGRKAPTRAGTRKTAGSAAKATPRAGQRGTTAAERRPQTTGRPTVSRGSVTVPFVNVRVPVVRATVPGIDAAKQQTMSAAQSVRFNLPPLDRLLYYGGLGVAAVAGALEWPVAVAAGAGVWIATRARRQASRIAPG